VKTQKAGLASHKGCTTCRFGHAKQNTYLRKPSYTRGQFDKVRAMLGQQAVGIAQIARKLASRDRLSTVYRIKGDPAGAEAALETTAQYLPAVGVRRSPRILSECCNPDTTVVALTR
jgi:hypothetical protein